ncbi:cupin domain-containing protein [Bacillus sp. 1P06AnD]|uniref:cupin domain-containing protein n=1 Tax=Bacillus sp. 1P06AnD TaxID=3132208 RepID=UPI0039A3F1EE
MEKVNEHDFVYRFGDYGPKYLLKGPNIDVGIVVLKPGQDFTNHYHTECEEVFFVLHGKIDFYVNEQKIHVQPGDLIQCRPLERHYLINRSGEECKALFIKSPHIAGRDSVEAPNPIVDKEE